MILNAHLQKNEKRLKSFSMKTKKEIYRRNFSQIAETLKEIQEKN